MGGGITGAKGDSAQNEQLQKMAGDYFNMAKPLFEQSQGQVGQILDKGPGQFSSLSQSFQDALQSGATHAYSPAINRATEAAGRAGSQGIQQVKDDLTRQNVTGSDYERQLGNTIQQMYFNTSQAPGALYQKQAEDASQFGYGQAGKNQDFYRDIVGSFYKALSGAPQVGLQGMANSAQNANQINAANTAAAQQFIGKMQDAAGTAAMTKCWIAARLYGRCSPEFYYARYWLIHGWNGRTAPLVQSLYGRYGERLARRSWLVRLLKPFFDWAVTQGRRAFYG